MDLKKRLSQYESFEDMLFQEKAIFLFFKNETCAPCKVVQAKAKELIISEFPKIQFVVANAEEHSELTVSLGIFSSPVMILFLDGKEYLREGNFVTVPDLRKKIRHYYQLYFEE